LYILTIFIVYFFITIVALLVHDVLLKRQYEHHRDTWIKSGCPRGFLFSPRNSSYAAYARQTFKNFESRFLWVHQDEEAIKIFKILMILKKIIILFSILIVP